MAVSNLRDFGTRSDERKTFSKVPFDGMSHSAHTAGKLLIRSGGKNNLLTGLYFSSSFPHGVLGKVEHIKVVAVMRKQKYVP